MHRHPFGNTGLHVSALALGTGGLGAQHDGTISHEAAAQIITTYLDAGGNLIDTAERYQNGQSEDLLGQLLGSRRDDIILASKFGASTQVAATPARIGAHRRAMAQSVEGSLRRLRTDRIDLYFVHLDDRITPIDEIMRGFDDLVHAGKILYSGLSNFPAWRSAQAATLADLRGWTPLAALEVEYSLLQRGIEREILPLATATNLAVLAYSPQAAGLLTGKPRPADSTLQRPPAVTREADPDHILDALRAVAADLATDPGLVAIAWVLARRVVPLLGARTADQLTHNLQAASLRLTAAHLEQLDIASAIPLGYPQELLAAVIPPSADRSTPSQGTQAVPAQLLPGKTEQLGRRLQPTRVQRDARCH